MVSLKNRFNVLIDSRMTNIRISKRINLKTVFLEYQFIKMQKLLLFFSVILLFSSCKKDTWTTESIKIDITSEEQKLVRTARTIIDDAYFGTLITVDANGQPKSRVMEPFSPDNDFIIWLATNPKSRKVSEIKANSTTTIHYFNKNNMEYVSLMGNAFLVNDETIKAQKFKDGWDKFYPNKKAAYLLIKFIPHTLELVSANNQYPGDSITWKPHQIKLRNN
ncbi:MAG: hypothetical protein COA67_03385 [Lutibacter sp.]|nr:MAG: hypothetical protein COA67_03385 [Lutibacter sp.]